MLAPDGEARAGNVLAVEVRLLGTGSADGWPNPWCSCASCDWARTAGELRTHTSALVDGVLLLDCGPDVPRAASRAGVSLGSVRWILLGHAHPDHTGPQSLLWRPWATAGTAPLEILGPPPSVAACRAFLDDHPDDAVTLTEVHPGDVLDRDGYRLRAWEADHGGPAIRPSLLWDVESLAPETPDGTGTGRRLLYGSDTLPLPDERLPTGPYDLVLLEETYGDGPPFGDHLGLQTFAGTLAALRRTGAMPDGGRAVAVHLGHANPPGPELARRLALLGAELHPDGALLQLDGPAVHPGPEHPKRVLVTGGSRSGKSEEAERRLLGEPEAVYAATALELPDDAEWTARLAAHRDRRPAHWTTVTTGRLAPLLREPGPPVLVDDVGFWLTRGEESADEFVTAFRETARRTVVVTGEVGSGVVPSSAAGRRFRDELGLVNSRLAAEADEVWHCVAGIARQLK
ncbi:MAG: adenosylcobinamide kinase / adenosylcobinamide-phosphate guanylyltransferase [Frankiaceae bacterium]|nr:adenosylcobinamide kinase / adenosylcobinamide-phosphate guanylyltransferase [Frankiaceae bacterium]